jgi:hypothetical protein
MYSQKTWMFARKIHAPRNANHAVTVRWVAGRPSISEIVTELMLWVEMIHVVVAAEAEVISRRIAGSTVMLIADEILQLRQRTPFATILAVYSYIGWKDTHPAAAITVPVDDLPPLLSRIFQIDIATGDYSGDAVRSGKH